MKYLNTLLLFCLISSLGIAQSNKKKTKKDQKKYTVEGKVMKVGSYCGGVEPSPEMLDEYTKPRVYAGKTFHIRKGNINTLKESVILSFKVDSTGKFSFQLPPGIYSIIQDLQVKEIKVKDHKKYNFTKADEECLKIWWKKPYHILEIKDTNITGLNFTFHHPCFLPPDIPCLQYTGPMPP